jgi:peptidoglycan/xylan/chitin deacetylase (PgdA/CDA1 family)
MAIRQVLSVALRAAYRTVELATGARLTILIFHRVVPKPDPQLPGEPDAAEFEHMMRIVRDLCNVVRLEDACNGWPGNDLPPRAVAITFDDGYADNATVAVPILRRLGLTATFFVATGYLAGGRMWNDSVIEAVRAHRDPLLDLSAMNLGRFTLTDSVSRERAAQSIINRLKFLDPPVRQVSVDRLVAHVGEVLPGSLMMNEAQVRDMAAAGMTIGAHTINHPILASVEDAAAEAEIAGSKTVLERLIGGPIRLFAYPNGMPERDYRRTHVEMVRSMGFAGAVSTSMGAATRRADRFQLPRFTPWGRSPWRFRAHMIRNLLRTRYAAT